MNGLRRVRVIWTDPMQLGAVLQLGGDDDYGLYQIYSHHVVFGPGALVYIGKAVEQTFATRFKQHEVDWLLAENDMSIRLGRLHADDYAKDDDWNDWRMLLGHTEALLIYWHSPPYNSQHISEYRGGGLHIQNRGNRGSILPECTSDWDSPRPRES